MTAVKGGDILNRDGSAPATDLQHFEQRFGIIFLNLAKDPTVLNKDDDNKIRLHGVLSDLYSILADNGSLVVALEDTKHDYDFLESERASPLQCIARNEVTLCDLHGISA